MSIRQHFPGGCYLAFNWVIDRQSSAKLVDAITSAHTEGYEQVHLMLSSTGGMLMDAHYAVECLAALPVNLVTWNVSSVQSAAVMLFALGVERYTVPGSTFLFHQTGFDGVTGQRNSEKEIREQLQLIHEGDKRLAELVAAEIECDVATIQGWQVGSKVLTDAAAVSSGLAHGIRRPDIPKDAFVRQITL